MPLAGYKALASTFNKSCIFISFKAEKKYKMTVLLENGPLTYAKPFSVMDAQQKETIVIRGYVESVPPGHDALQKAKVSIVTEDGTIYYVLPKGVGTELLQHISAPVEIRGTPSENGETLFIQVSTFQVEDGYDDSWYDAP